VGERNGSEGKSHATFTRNQYLCIFLFSYETTLLSKSEEGVGGGVLVPHLTENRYKVEIAYKKAQLEITGLLAISINYWR
jgi:hypothetical protein